VRPSHNLSTSAECQARETTVRIDLGLSVGFGRLATGSAASGSVGLQRVRFADA